MYPPFDAAVFHEFPLVFCQSKNWGWVAGVERSEPQANLKFRLDAAEGTGASITVGIARDFSREAAKVDSPDREVGVAI